MNRTGIDRGDGMRVRALGFGAAVSLAYLLAARLGFHFAFVAEQVTTVWAPTGIAIAALLLWGRALWPSIWIGAFLANAGTQIPLWAAAAIATGNTLEAIAAASLLRRVPGFDARLRSARDAVAFLIAAAAISTTISATLGALTLCMAHVQPWEKIGSIWSDWWLGDALGAVVVAPAILTLARPSVRWTRAALIETALVLLATIVTTHIVFSDVLGSSAGGHPLEFIIFWFVIAAAVRLQPASTALVVLAASALTIWNTANQLGPFAGPEVHQSLILLQTFMAVLACTGMLLAAAIAERRTGAERRAVAYAVAETLGRAGSLLDAAPAILRSFCEILDFHVATLWLVDADGAHMSCAAISAQPARSTSVFQDASRARKFAPDEGVPGRVWSSRQAVWIEDVQNDPNFPRVAAAREVGIHGAFALPICFGADVIGVIECFHRNVLMPDRDLLSTMSSVGSQIGQFAGRKRIETTAARDRHELLERELRARRDAENANRAKDEFLATLSHELRTPLNAIVGWTRMLIDGTLDADGVKRALQVIDRNAQLQTRLVADILDVSRIISGGLRLDLRPVQLAVVIGAAVDAVRPAADAKKITLTSHLDPIARMEEADPERLQQIVWNLLANAVKFTASGGLVTVELLDCGEEGVRIRVSDNGAGIDPTLLPHVFERFWQADGSTSRRHGGLGLGLAIVRHLVELHGGMVGAQSAGPGAGSTFIVDLPKSAPDRVTFSGEYRPVSLDGTGKASRSAVAGCRILVVDDHDEARELVQTILEREGASVRTASSVSDALKALEQSPVDVLLADLGMPGADGFALIREVRKRDAGNGHRLPAAAVTAYASPEDRVRALSAGFDRHVPKPVNPAAILDAVAALWTRK